MNKKKKSIVVKTILFIFLTLLNLLFILLVFLLFKFMSQKMENTKETPQQTQIQKEKQTEKVPQIQLAETQKLPQVQLQELPQQTEKQVTAEPLKTPNPIENTVENKQLKTETNKEIVKKINNLEQKLVNKENEPLLVEMNDEIKEKINEWNKKLKKSNDKKTYYQDDGKTIAYINELDKDTGEKVKETFYYDDGKTIAYINELDKDTGEKIKETFYQDGKTIIDYNPTNLSNKIKKTHYRSTENGETIDEINEFDKDTGQLVKEIKIKDEGKTIVINKYDKDTGQLVNLRIYHNINNEIKLSTNIDYDKNTGKIVYDRNTDNDELMKEKLELELYFQNTNIQEINGVKHHHYIVPDSEFDKYGCIKKTWLWSHLKEIFRNPLEPTLMHLFIKKLNPSYEGWICWSPAFNENNENVKIMTEIKHPPLDLVGIYFDKGTRFKGDDSKDDWDKYTFDEVIKETNGAENVYYFWRTKNMFNKYFESYKNNSDFQVKINLNSNKPHCPPFAEILTQEIIDTMR